jgi:STE24 endopeptidase
MASRFGLLAVFLLAWSGAVAAQDLPPAQQLPPVAAPTQRVDVGQLPALDTTPQFDAGQATRTYLARIGGAARQKSDAYTDSGYWLGLVDLVYGLGVAALLLWLQISARIRDWVEDRTHSRALQAMLYGAVYVTVVTVLSLPLSLYEGFFREHAYGLSNQTFPQWLGDFATLFLVTVAAAVIVLPVLYAAIRASRQLWWLWGAGVAIVFLVIGLVIAQVAIEPLFNRSCRWPAPMACRPKMSGWWMNRASPSASRPMSPVSWAPPGSR